MTHMFVDHVQNAYESLRRNRARTLLTTLGITIGIASVTCILAISTGVSQLINGQIDSFSGQLAVIRPGLQSRDPNALVNPVARQSFSTSSLTESDVEALQDIKHAEAVVPLMTINGTVTSSTGSEKDNVVLATTYDFPKVADITMRSGQFLDEQTSNTTAVIGQQLALDLYGTDDAIGQLLTIRGQQFTVIGVIKNSKNPINYNNVDLNNAVVVNFERGVLFHQGRSQIQQIDVLADSPKNLGAVVHELNRVMLAQHLGEEDFSITSGRDISRPTNELFSAITTVMTAIAAISLVVGGIGIMNIMLVGVAERTREIGIRKAVGASRGNIVSQFLVESLMISILGGLLGYFFGYVAAFVISTFLYFVPALTWMTAAAAAIMALGIGSIFGIYPAVKAARKNTIESLRQYH